MLPGASKKQFRMVEALSWSGDAFPTIVRWILSRCKEPLLDKLSYILESTVIPHFDNHPLLTRPILMDDNARPHRSRAVIECLRQNAVSRIPWPAYSPDLNPIDHLWDILSRKVRAMNPTAQNLAELEAALHREWRQIPQRQIQCLVQGMLRRLRAVINVRRGHTRY